LVLPLFLEKEFKTVFTKTPTQMKKLLFFIAASLVSCFFNLASLNAQVPNAIPYQAVARDASGNVIANQNIRLRLTIGAALQAYYVEVHTVTTNAFGLFTVNVGSGTSQSVAGGVAFSAINWEAGGLNLAVEMDATGGTNYTYMGTNPLQSVPYALHAKNGVPSGTAGQTLRNNGTNYVSTSNLYNDGNKIGIGTTTPFSKLHVEENLWLETGRFENTGGNPSAAGPFTGITSSATGTGGGNRVGVSALALNGTENTGISSNAIGGSTAYGIKAFASGAATNYAGYFGDGNVFVQNNVGIGTFPTAKLEVAGTTKTTNFQMTTGAGASKVLTSDASGNASWQTPSGGSGTSLPTAQYGQTLYGFVGQNGPQWNATYNLYNDGTRIGISNQNPEFRLSVGDGSSGSTDGGIMAKGTYSSGSTLTTAGAGTRMFWYPRKAAFRAGGVTGTQWDETNVGSYSFAAGLDNQAKGVSSTALGYQSLAFGLTSFAAGTQATASGNNSSAIGNYVATNNFEGAMVLGDNSTTTTMLSPGANTFASRFVGGYSLYSDMFNTDANGMFFTAGKLGLGVLSPTAKLDVAGTVKIADGTQGVNKVFTSDANGNASWQTPVIGAGTANGNTPYWNNTTWVTNSNTLYNNGTNVGIGTNTPATKLDVNGQATIRGGNPQPNYVLTAVDNAGTAVWAQAPSAAIAAGTAAGNTPYWNGNAWVANSSNIYNNGGNVGINTNTPATTLDINGSVRYSTRSLSNTTGLTTLAINDNDNIVIINDMSVGGVFSTSNITGISTASHLSGRIIRLMNVTNHSITLEGQNAAGGATNFVFGYDPILFSYDNYTIPKCHSVTLIELPYASGYSWFLLEQ
jgi:hypothetical protein